MDGLWLVVQVGSFGHEGRDVRGQCDRGTDGSQGPGPCVLESQRSEPSIRLTLYLVHVSASSSASSYRLHLLPPCLSVAVRCMLTAQVFTSRFWTPWGI